MTEARRDIDYTTVAAALDAHTESMTDIGDNADMDLIEDNQVAYESSDTIADAFVEGNLFATEDDEDIDFDPCTCGCGSIVCSAWTLCAGCTDLASDGPGALKIAGEFYCFPCYEAYQLDGTVNE